MDGQVILGYVDPNRAWNTTTVANGKLLVENFARMLVTYGGERSW